MYGARIHVCVLKVQTVLQSICKYEVQCVLAINLYSKTGPQIHIHKLSLEVSKERKSTTAKDTRGQDTALLYGTREPAALCCAVHPSHVFNMVHALLVASGDGSANDRPGMHYEAVHAPS